MKNNNIYWISHISNGALVGILEYRLSILMISNTLYEWYLHILNYKFLSKIRMRIYWFSRESKKSLKANVVTDLYLNNMSTGVEHLKVKLL